MSDAEQVWDTAGCAAYLGIEPSVLIWWRGRGEGPPFVRLSHKRLRYRKSDVDAWMTSRMEIPKAGGAA